MIGETIQYVIALPMIYIGVLSANKILHLVILDSLVQFLILILLAFPAGFIAFLLKRAEKLDTYDKTIFFNPLRLKD